MPPAKQPFGEQRNHAVHMHSAIRQLGIIHLRIFGLRQFPDSIVFFMDHCSFLIRKKWPWIKTAFPVSSQISSGRASTPLVCSSRKNVLLVVWTQTLSPIQMKTCMLFNTQVETILNAADILCMIATSLLISHFS